MLCYLCGDSLEDVNPIVRCEQCGAEFCCTLHRSYHLQDQVIPYMYNLND